MSLDLELAANLTAEIDRLIAEGTESLANALPYDQYQQACGMLEGYRQVRHGLIPKLLDELQRR